MTFQSFPTHSNSIFEVIVGSTQVRRICGTYGDNEDKYAELVLIKAGAALTAGQVYELPLISGTDAYVVDTGLTTALVDALTTVGELLQLCVPASDLAVGEYGWAFVKGQFDVSGSNTMVVGSRVLTTGTSGVVGDNDTGTQHPLSGTIVLSDPGAGPAPALISCVQDLHVAKRQ